MHTGYDNYWMCNRQEILPDLLKNDNLSRGMSIDSYRQIQDEMQPSLLTRYLSSRNNAMNKNRDVLSTQQIPPQYPWTPTPCGQPTRPYGYQNGHGMQQKDPRMYYQRQSHLDNRNNTPQINNNVGHLEGQSTTPRIRVRDVNSLNNLARNSMMNCMQQGQFNRYTGCPYDERQQNLPQKNNTEHANHIPSLFEVNAFQPPYQRSIPVPKRPACWDVFSTQKKRPYISPNQYHARRKDSPNEIPTTVLEELLNFTRTQLDSIQDAETPMNPPMVNNTIKANNLTSLLENSYSPGRSSYGNPPPYSDVLQRIEVPLTTQGNSLPIIEPISPPPVENNVTQSAQPIRVTAVISLPNLSSINSNYSSLASVPCNEGSNYVPDSTTKECENPTLDTPVPNNDDLIVKEEPVLSSTFLSEESNIEIVIQTMKTEIIQEENAQKTENNNEQSRRSNSEDKNVDVCKNDDKKEEVENEPKKTTSVSDVKLESNYKSKINRDKLDRLIEFLNDDKHLSYKDKCNNKKHKKVDGKEKEPIPRVEITRCSSELSQNVTSDDCVKNTQKNSGLEKQSQEKIKGKKSVDESTKDKCEKKKTKRKRKVVDSENQTSVEKMQKPKEKKNSTKDDEGMSLSLPIVEDNESEKPNSNETPKTAKPSITVELFQVPNEAKDGEGAGKANGRVFSNFNYHFCGNCNLVSPIEWFWINAVTGDLKCLNCFKRMNLDAVETTHKLGASDGKDPEPREETPKSPSLKIPPTGDGEKQTSQKINEETKHKEKRKSVDESPCHERREKNRKSDEKSDKRVEQSGDKPQCLKIDKCRKSSKDGSQSPKGEERFKKNSDQIRSASKEKQEVSEGDAGKKRRNSKEEVCAKKIRVVEESAEESAKVKKQKEWMKNAEGEDLEKRRKATVKEKDLQKKPKSCHKMLHSLFEDPPPKPLKEKQNTKMKFEKQKKPDGVKKDGEKKKSERKSSCIKGPLQYKDFVLNKTPECCFPEMMESFPLRKVMDASKKKYNGRNEDMFAKLKKKTKTLSLNLLKDT